jgi:hypothetical protein
MRRQLEEAVRVVGERRRAGAARALYKEHRLLRFATGIRHYQHVLRDGSVLGRLVSPRPRRVQSELEFGNFNAGRKADNPQEASCTALHVRKLSSPL